MGRSRRRRGVFGPKNSRHRLLMDGYTLKASSLLPVTRALLAWLRLELTEGWRSWWPERKTAAA